MIPPRYIRPLAGTNTPPYSPNTEETIATSESSIPETYRCDLCNTSFKTEEELSKHVVSQH